MNFLFFMIFNNNLVKISYFNDVIQIEDNFNVNTFLDRLSREESKHRVKDLNSVFIKHMFSRTENPSDSEISPEYMERIHETGAILLNFSDKIQSLKVSEGLKLDGFNHFAKRMKNLIDLINAEKFDFEDLHAWRMGSKMEALYREKWKILSEQFSKMKISLNYRIRQNATVRGKISSIGEIHEIVDENQRQMIKLQKDSISAIRDLELEKYYKDRLIHQLSDQIRNESRDLKIVLTDFFRQYEHELKRTKGKFSNSILEKTIGELIEKEKTVENISEKEILQKFNQFWNEIIKSREILDFRAAMRETQNEQLFKYRRDLKKGFEECFDIDRFDIVTNQEFENLKSIEEWDFTEEQFKKIKILGDDKYFKKTVLKSVRTKLEAVFSSTVAHKQKQFMPQILNQYISLINTNPNTKKDFDGFVDNTIILNLCSEFELLLRLKIEECELDEFVKPLFKVHIVGFACFKLLLPRLQQNLNYYQKSKDPVNELNTKQDYFRNLYRSKLLGAKQSVLWEQKFTYSLQNLLVEIYLSPSGSQETHDYIYKFIQGSGANPERNNFYIDHFLYYV